MTPRGFAILACRLVAVVLVAYALQQLALNAQVYTVSGLSLGARIVAFVAGMFTPLAGAAILWFGAPRIAGSVADDAGTATSDGLDEVAFIRAGTALIGLAFATLALANGIVFESLMLLQSAEPELDAAYLAAKRQQVFEHRVDYLARIALGVLLMLGRERIASVLGTRAPPR